MPWLYLKIEKGQLKGIEKGFDVSNYVKNKEFVEHFKKYYTDVKVITPFTGNEVAEPLQ